MSARLFFCGCAIGAVIGLMIGMKAEHAFSPVFATWAVVAALLAIAFKD